MSDTGPKTNWKMTDDTIRKLESAFAIDATVDEACFFADISRDTFYRWTKDNPELSDRFNRLRNSPVLKARQTVVDALDDPDMAFKYLERKKKDEFSLRQEMTGKDGKDLPTPILAYVVPSDHGDEKDNGDDQTPAGGAGGDVGQQDGLDTP